MDVLAELIADWPGPILDPYAGIGRVHELGRDDTWGIEIESVWADRHKRTIHADSSTLGVHSDTHFQVPELKNPWDMSYEKTETNVPRPRSLVFSPDYGNRMSDQYLGTPEEQEERERTGKLPRRRSYAISLGRTVTEGSSCRYKFGPLYRATHAKILEAVTSVVRASPDEPAKMGCNVSDFFETKRKGEEPGRVFVVSFWIELLASLGWVVERLIPVTTSRFRDGANSDLRVEAEQIIVAHHTGGRP